MAMKCAIALVVTGVLVLTVGIILPTVFNIVLKGQMKTMLPLVNGSYTFDKWRDLPVPMFMQFWVFDVVNADEVTENGAKPVVVERGPYTYRVRKEKVNITSNPNKTVTYRQVTWYYFDRDMSVGEDSDNFTTVNNILLGLSYVSRFEYAIIKELVKLMLDTMGGRLFETYTVRGLIWGYEDPMMKFGKDIFGLFQNLTHFDDHFGVFYKWNGSDNGLYTIFTGEENLSRMGKIDRFNGLKYSPFWSTTYARMINGTDGNIFPPFLDKEKLLYFYSPEACRTMHMEYSGATTSKGISAYKFILPNSNFKSATVNPNNVGFCTPDKTHCMPSGVLNVSACRDASSAALSYPHFLGGDPELLHGVQGLNPDPTQHTSYLDLEPTLGVPLDGGMRLQVSVYISKFADIRQLQNKTYFHPIFWFNETATITDDLADQLRSMLVVQNIVTVSHYLLPCLGSITIVTSVVYIVLKLKTKNKKEDNEHGQKVTEEKSEQTGLLAS